MTPALPPAVIRCASCKATLTTHARNLQARAIDLSAAGWHVQRTTGPDNRSTHKLQCPRCAR